VDTNTESLANNQATGFMFGPATSVALEAAIGRAVDAYARPVVWKRIMLSGMARQFSWEDAAQKYLTLYKNALDSVAMET
jgi:starch synthase